MGSGLQMYDIQTDTMKEVTQKDLDQILDGLAAMARQREGHKEPMPPNPDFAAVKLATYINPHRSDGLFVAEDKPIEAYDGIKSWDGRALYPAVPRTAFCLGSQVEPSFAREIVRRWNIVGEAEANNGFV